MKKEVVTLLVLLLILPITTAEYICSDESEVEWDNKEIEVGSSKAIRGLRLGVIKTEEVGAINLISADIIIEGTRVTLENNISEEIILSTGTYKASLRNFTDTTARIIIDGSEKEITIKEIEKIKGVEVALTKIETETVKIIVGTEKVYLSNKDTQTKEYTAENKTYIIELSSASDSQATLKVNTCKTGKIQEVEPQETNNETIINETTTENNQTEEINITEKNETIINETTNTIQTIPEQERDLSIFQKFINWLKNLFS